jgi:hypothetical protein
MYLRRKTSSLLVLCVLVSYDKISEMNIVKGGKVDQEVKRGKDLGRRLTHPVKCKWRGK